MADEQKKYLSEDDMGFGTAPAKSPAYLSESDMGFGSNGDNALTRGWKKAGQSIAISKDIAAGDTAGAARTIKEASDYAKANPGMKEGSELMDAWKKGDGITGGISGVASEIAKDYREAKGFIPGVASVGKNLQAMGSGIVEQVSNSVAPIAGMVAGGFAGAKGGAAIGGALGSVAGGVGAAPGAALGGTIGGAAGAWAGASAGNAAIEGGFMAQEAISKAGISPGDQESVKAYLDQNRDALMKQAAVKGGIIGAVDTATMGIAGRLLNAPAKAAAGRALSEMGIDAADRTAAKAAMETPAFKQLIANDAVYQASKTGAERTARNMAAAALDPAGEFAGEYLGQGVATGEWDAKNAALEAFSSVGQSAGMFAGQKAYQAIKRPSEADAPSPAQEEGKPLALPAPAPSTGTPGEQLQATDAERAAQVAQADANAAEIYRQRDAFDAARQANQAAAPIPFDRMPAEELAAQRKAAMGIDPAAGPLSAGAAIAVDTGVAGQMQAAAQAVTAQDAAPQQAAGPLTGSPLVGAARQDPAAAWNNMSMPERAAVAGRVGLPPVVANNIPRTGWEGLNPDLQARISKAMAPAAPATAPSIEGADLGNGWAKFSAESGTAGVPRAEMPQIKAEHRGAMVNFMNARGVAHQEETLPASSLKPTQAEFSREKVARAAGFEGGDRAILVSSDNHILDGHHQWMAAREKGEDVRAIRLNAPIRDLIGLAHDFPSSTKAGGASGPGSDAGNGFKHGPQAGERYRVGQVSSVGGAIALEKRLPAGTDATFYVGVDGILIDGDSLNLISNESRSRLWIPANSEQASQAQHILDEMGRLALSDPRRAEMKRQLKSLVTNSAQPTQVPGESDPREAYADEKANAYIAKRGGSAPPKAGQAAPFRPKNLVQLVREAGGVSIDRKADINQDSRTVGVFRKGGMDLDGLAELLQQNGFMTDADVTDTTSGAERAAELLRAALAGERVLSMNDVDEAVGRDAEAQYRDEIRRKASEYGIRTTFRPFGDVEREVLARDGELAPEDRSEFEYGGDVAYTLEPLDDIDLQDARTISEEDQMRMAGFSEDEINETINGTGFRESQGAPEQAQSGTAQESRDAGAQEDQSQEGSSEGLTSYTNEDIARQEAAQRATAADSERAQREADQKAQADAERDTFALTGSDRAADVMAAQGQGGLFDATQEAGAGYTVEERKKAKRDDYTQDLFGNAVPDTPGGAGVGQQSASAENRNLLAAASVPGAVFATVTGARQTGELKTAFPVVDTASKAAHTFAGLRKRTTEHFAVLVLNAKSEPIAYSEMFSGGTSATSIYPDAVAKFVYGTPGASSFWISHNHPSGSPTPSNADIQLTKVLSKAYGQGTGVEMAGHVIIAGGKASMISRDGAIEEQGFAIPAMPRRNTIPVMRRDILRLDTFGDSITSPATARVTVRGLSGKESGVVFLNAQNAPVAFLPMSQATMVRLRDGKSARALFGAAAKSNASAAMIHLGAQHSRAELVAASKNLHDALSGAGDIRILDAFLDEGDKMYSLAESGDISGSANGVFMSRSEPRSTAPSAITAESLPDTITIDGVERPTTNSNGKPIHSTEEGVRKFWEWFADSKIVDELGRPLVVYHGTNAEFNVFQTSADGVYGPGSYLTKYDGDAATYGRNVMPVYASLQNPYVATPGEARRAKKDGGTKAWSKSIQDRGYDGIILQDMSVVVAFRPEQIKSATGNAGTFDPASPDIRRSAAAPSSASGITAESLPGIFAQRFPKLAGAIKTMLDRGALGQKGGLVVLDTNDETQIAREFADRTGRTFDETVQMFESGVGPEINGFYDALSGTTFLVGPNLDGDTASAVVMHEMVHGQQRRSLDEKSLALIKDRANLPLPLGKFLTRVAQRMEDVGESNNATEATSYIVEMAVQEGRQAGFSAADGPILAWIEKNIGKPVADLVREFVAMARAWALAHGVDLKRITVDDLVAYAKLGLKRAADGRVVTFGRESGNIAAMSEREGVAGKQAPTPSNSPDVKFSRAALGPLSAAQQSTVERIFGKPKTLRERAEAFAKDWQKNLVQGIFDQFAPIKELTSKGYMLARLAKGSDSTLEAMLVYGKVSVDADGVYKVDFDGKNLNGFAKTMAKLDGEHDRFLAWVSGQRAERLSGVGLENLMTPADIAALQSLADGNTKSGKVRRALYADALKDLNAFNDSVLKIAADSGLIDEATREMYRDVPYVPFYRLSEEDVVQGPSVSKGLVNQAAWKQLKGGTNQLNEDLMGNLLKNWSHLITASANNRAAKEVLDTAARMGAATDMTNDVVAQDINGQPIYRGNTKGLVRYRGEIKRKIPKGQPYIENGQTLISDGTAEISYVGDRYFKVDDPHLMDAISSIGFTTKVWKPMADFKRYLTFGVTVNPTFKIRNLIRDSIQAVGTAELSYNPVQNILMGAKGTAMMSNVRAQMMASGGMLRFGSAEGGYSGHVRRLIEKGVDPQYILDDDNKIKAFWKHKVLPAFEAYQELGDRSENVNRAALYEQMLTKGMSHAEASFWARDMMDFSMHGKWAAIRTLTAVVPFMNARLQGIYKLGRATKADYRRMGATLAAVSLASMALMLAYGDDDDWKKREDWDRDNSWWFKIGDTAFRIPKPFEVGAIGTIAERSLELMISDEMTGKRFGERMRDLLMHNLSMNPTPQLIKPMIDLYANKDGFSGREIETQGMEKLRPEDRYTNRTSEVARFLGQIGLPNPAQLLMGRVEGLSPVQIDHLIRGYFAWVGTSATTALDYGIRPMMDRGDRPDMRLKDVFLVGNFVQSLPSGSSRYVTQFYAQAKEIEQMYASYQQAIKEGNTEKAQEIRADNAEGFAARRRIESAKRAQSLISGQMRTIERSREMSGEEKRARLDQLEKQRDRMARQALLVTAAPGRD